ncbi:MmcQ/YjbR family DNA-binding protein [Arthrobacter sp. ISL-85]|uniref:MmcQ/YjbR family DNA-binding protein n=1 Tax=Arthrobacter sp. ISL-85 TaxID=2819115 RepID=UPI001BEBCF95|nr:MmcQ/YjbR family DNA-binding protein [Arthrobacter sp. ISL-85]MBT2565065.1 MmcQ/YjbR family DNA-binding protein [Arthrobacter sp. ISL-85]
MQQIARDTAAALGDVSNGRPFTPHLEVWKVQDKVFLIITEDDPDQQIITVKADPHYVDALRHEHDSITRGHYLDKQHWISVGPGPGVTKRLVEDLVQDSYDIVSGHHPEQRS